jgi:hypothetical protein
MEGLAVAIRAAVGNEKIQEQALALGGKIRTEDGVGTAVSMIENLWQAR